MNKQDKIRIKHIIDAGREAIGFASGKSRRELDNDRMLVLSVVKCIELIGEAGSRVSEETQEQYPEIPWSIMIGMRNRLVHVYFDIDLDIVWQTVRDDLPTLVAQLEQVV